MLLNPNDPILEEILRLSGPNLKGTHPIPYSSYHLENFTILDTQRNTLDRLQLFNFPNTVPKWLEILDLGSNTGAISLELANRGAKVIGLEYNQERVDICNRLANATNLPATFHRADFETWNPERQFTIVFCLSIDAHIKNKDFISNVAKATDDVCYFESNDKNRDQHIFLSSMSDIDNRPFRYVNYLGDSYLPSDHSQGKPRELFVMSNKRFPYVGGRIISANDKIIKYYPSEIEFEVIKNIYPRIADIPYVPRMEFYDKCAIIEKIVGKSILEQKPTNQNKLELIEFIKLMHEAGVVHRDLSPKNILLGETIKIIDWDFVCDAQNTTYDLDGKGLPSPRWTYNTHLFKMNKNGVSTACYFNLARSEISLR